MSNIDPKFKAAVTAAIARKDADELEAALNLDSGHEADRTQLYEDLLLETWHRSHEDIIRYLQKHPTPSSIDVLRAAITLKPRLKYLDYDDYGSYYKKCLWALAVNPNPTAIEVIREFSTHHDKSLQKEAQYRLAKIDQR